MVHYVHRHSAPIVSQKAAMSESHGCKSTRPPPSAGLNVHKEIHLRCSLMSCNEIWVLGLAGSQVT